MNVGDVVVVRWGEIPSKTRPRIARVASTDPLAIQMAGRRAPGCVAASGSKTEFRPKWMEKVWPVQPEAIVRPATRRELVLGYPDPTALVTP